jgi:Alpha/beta hydrolase domain
MVTSEISGDLKNVINRDQSVAIEGGREMTRRSPRLGGWRLSAAVFALVAPCGPLLASATAAATTPSVYTARAVFSGPLTTGKIVEPETARPTGLATYDYVEREFVASGTANSFVATATPSNGQWSIEPGTSATYRTRIIVRRPAKASKFNGTVVVEWMNESGGESAPDWDYLNPYLMSAGYAYVAVSAQSLGVNGGTSLLGDNAVGLVKQDPTRYGSLHQPGDQYAQDIFAQVGAALRSPKAAVLGTLRPRHVIAVGESQSAAYLTTFADAIQPRTHTFDGIFIHSRGVGAAPLSGSGITSAQASKPVHIRTDTSVPVFMSETQTDLALGYALAQQPNTKMIRTWEIAGTSHADTWIVGSYATSLGCTGSINDGPQHLVVQAAFAAFDHWVTQGVQPPSPPRIKLKSLNPTVFDTDSHGNVLGGVRTPAVDVPISTLSNVTPPGSSVTCSLFGSTAPFSPAQLQSLYGSTASYTAAYKVNLNRAIAAGYILPADRAALIALAKQVDIGS